MDFAIPEGARLQLDPSLTEKDFDRMGLDRTGKIIAQGVAEIRDDFGGPFRIF